MMTVTMIMMVPLRAGDIIFSRTEWSPPVVGKGGNSVFSPSNDRVVTDEKLHQDLSRKHNIGGT